MKRALLATDASPSSQRAAKLLGQMARHDPEMQVIVLHVVPLPEVLTPAAAAGAPLTLPGRLDDYLANRVDAVLQSALEALDLPADRVKTTHVIGIAASAILSEAQENGCELIVMGRRGRSTLKELIMGSVSQEVLHRSACPVCIVP